MSSNISHSDPATAKVNGFEIVYDTFGDPSSLPLLLIMGLGGQMIAWDDDFCAQLADQGYWAIRYDNRDIGLSTKLSDMDVPDFSALIRALEKGQAITAPYSIRDMADDAVGLLDALEIQRAHVVGLSMGGMIVQRMAIHYPQRASTLTSIMSSLETDLPRATDEALAILFLKPPSDRAEYIEQYIRNATVLNGPVYALDEVYARKKAGRYYDRGLSPEGFARQFAAILASPGRREDLKSIKIPALIIHGDADPLVPVELGIDTADAIPGAKKLIIEGMGHGLPPRFWPEVIDAIANHAA